MSLSPQVCKKNYKVHIPDMGEECEFWLVTVTDEQSITNPDKDHAYLTDDNSLYVYNGKELVLVGFEHIYTTSEDLDQFLPNYDDCDCKGDGCEDYVEKLAIKETAEGNPTIISDSADWRLQKLNIYGQSEQDSTTGKNLLNPTGATKVGWNIELPNFRLEVGKQYTYTAPFLGGSGASGLYAKASDTQLAPYMQSGATKTFTVPEEADFSQGILLAGDNEDALTLGDELTAMVELGSVATEFEPYTGGKPSPSPDYPQEIISKEVSEIKVTGANLIKYPFYSGTRVVNGVTFTVNDDQSITINGTNDGTGNSEIRININNRFKKGDAISTGLLSDKNDENIWANAFYITNIGTNSKVENSIVDDDSKKYDIILTVKTGATIDNVTVKFMRNYGSTLLSYEPYKEQTITLSDPITLRGIRFSGGSVTIDGKQYFSDVIKEKDGVIGVERDVGKLVFDGSDDEIWSVNSTDLITCIRGEIYPPRNTTYPDSLIATGMFDKLNFLASFRDDSEHGYCQSGIFIFIDKSRLSSLDADGLKAFLKSNSITTIFKVENPTFEPLPEEIQEQYKALKSYYPNTVIQTGAFNEVEYVADTKMYIDKKLSEISSQLTELKADTLLLGGM